MGLPHKKELIGPTSFSVGMVTEAGNLLIMFHLHREADSKEWVETTNPQKSPLVTQLPLQGFVSERFHNLLKVGVKFSNT